MRFNNIQWDFSYCQTFQLFNCKTDIFQFSVLTENQCVYKFFEILAKIKQIGSTTFHVKMGEDEVTNLLSLKF